MTGVVYGLHVNPQGGVPKFPVDVLEIHATGCVGDKQNDTRHHGGPERAVCLMERRIMTALQEAGHPIQPGTTGENLLIDGLDPGSLAVGVVLQIGEVQLTITSDAPPCKTIRGSFEDGAFKNLSHRATPGQTRWYARVNRTGAIQLGDSVEVNSSEPIGNQ